MGSTEIFASSGNFIISFVSLLILGITLLMISQGKLVVKKALLCVYLGLVLEFITVGISYKVNSLYTQGYSIDSWVFLELILVLIAMLFFAIASLRILVNNVPEAPVIGTLGGIGGVASIYFVYIYPNSYMIANMQQIFILTGFVFLSIAFASQLHRKHNGGYLGGTISCAAVSVILLLRLLGIFYDCDIL